MKRKIILFGAGNVATRLGLALKKAGHRIVMIYNRSEKSASELAALLECPFSIDFNAKLPDADLCIIALKDDAMEKAVSGIKFGNQLLVHTSGSLEMNTLNSVSDRIGVFYPLQTLHKSTEIEFRQVPVCIEANNERDEDFLFELAKTISNNVHKVNSDQRKVLHVAAVFACNFSNHLYAIAEDILNKNQLSIDLLKPLILETALKIQAHSPASVQTGPAARGDDKIIGQHLEFLENEPEYRDIYRLLSAGISKM